MDMPMFTNDSPLITPDRIPENVSPGQLLRMLRRACAMSQDQVATLLHTSRSSYGSYERDERPLPPELLMRCAGFYGLPPTAFLEPGNAVQILPPVTEDEKDLLACYRNLDPDGRRQILNMIHYESTLAAM